MKTQNKKITLALLLLTTFFFSCNKNDDDTIVEPETIVEPTIYVVGGDTMWKSEQGADFTRTVIGNARLLTDIFLDGDDIYIGGSMLPRKAQIWKNREPTLQPSEGISDIYKVFVEDGDVYGIGNVHRPPNSNSVNVSSIWKNGVVTEIEDNTNEGIVIGDLYVKDNDVYLAGQLGNKPTVWKNEIPTLLSNEIGKAKSVFVKDNDVYVSGSMGDFFNTGMYWKNGEEHTLNGSDITFVTAIFVDGDDVYVAGSQTINDATIAAVWKNGEPTNLTNSTRFETAADLVVHNGDVYVCGYGLDLDDSGSKFFPLFWKNGERINLPITTNQENENVLALGIAVK